MPSASQSSDEQILRKLDADWGDAATRHDLEAVVAFYAEDGSLVWPGAPAHHGRQKIHAAWSEMFKMYKGLTLSFFPERIDIAPGGEMAADFGKVTLGQDTAKGHVEETAKYVVVWKKVEGAWKVFYDCYNMNTDAG